MGFLDSLKSLFGGGQKEENTEQVNTQPVGDQSADDTANATEETTETAEETTPEEPEKTEGSV